MANLNLHVQQDYIPVTVHQGTTIICPDAIMRGKKNKSSMLEWRMKTDRFKIKDIVFATVGRNEFHQGISTGTGWEVEDKMSAYGDFKYTIEVEKTVGGGKPLTLDPMIRNEP